MRRQWKQCQTLFFEAPKSLWRWLQPWNLKMLTPWNESYDEPRQHIKKQRHYFANKGPSSQGYAFPVVKYGCENWTVKKAECRRIDAFELWCWRRLLRTVLLASWLLVSDLISLCFKLVISKMRVIIVPEYVCVLRISQNNSDMGDDDIRGHVDKTNIILLCLIVPFSKYTFIS